MTTRIQGSAILTKKSESGIQDFRCRAWLTSCGGLERLGRLYTLGLGLPSRLSYFQWSLDRTPQPRGAHIHRALHDGYPCVHSCAGCLGSGQYRQVWRCRNAEALIGSRILVPDCIAYTPAIDLKQLPSTLWQPGP